MRTLLRPTSSSPVLTDLALLVARVALGVILVAHGWQKYAEWTVAGTAAAFGDLGVPAPGATAAFVTGVEVLGGLALIVGLLTPVVAVLNLVNMAGALLLVHARNGVFVADNGFELVLALFAGLVLVAMLGAGRFSTDGLITRSVRTAG